MENKKNKSLIPGKEKFKSFIDDNFKKMIRDGVEKIFKKKETRDNVKGDIRIFKIKNGN